MPHTLEVSKQIVKPSQAEGTVSSEDVQKERLKPNDKVKKCCLFCNGDSNHEEHKIRCNKYAREWKRNNKDRVLKHTDKRNFGGNRERTLLRDGYKCVTCGMTNDEHLNKYRRSLTVHHIDGKGIYSEEKNHALSNLQTLCLVCHSLADNIRTRKTVQRPRKLSDENIKYIRSTYVRGMGSELANKFGVTRATISLVIKGMIPKPEELRKRYS